MYASAGLQPTALAMPLLLAPLLGFLTLLQTCPLFPQHIRRGRVNPDGE